MTSPKIAVVLVFCFGLCIDLSLTANLYEFNLDYSRSNIFPIVNSGVQNPWTDYAANARNYTYVVENDSLRMSMIPKNDTTILSLYLVRAEFRLPLQPSLNLSFSVCANLSSYSDGAFILISLSDGGEVIETSYYIGQGLPDYTKENYYHVGYQVANATNICLASVRNIWADAIEKTNNTNSPWRIEEVKVGILSRPTTPSIDGQLELMLNLNDSFFEGDANYVHVEPSSINLSLSLLTLLVSVTLALYLIDIALRKKLQ